MKKSVVIVNNTGFLTALFLVATLASAPLLHAGETASEADREIARSFPKPKASKLPYIGTVKPTKTLNQAVGQDPYLGFKPETNPAKEESKPGAQAGEVITPAFQISKDGKQPGSIQNTHYQN
jgi:hypothetical protein